MEKKNELKTGKMSFIAQKDVEEEKIKTIKMNNSPTYQRFQLF